MKTYKSNRNNVGKTTRKMHGGGDFTVMTFNVESWLNLIKPIYADENMNYLKHETKELRENFKQYLALSALSKSKSKSKSQIDVKWKDFKKIFNGINILCVQEDVIMGNENSKDSKNDKENFIEKIQPYHGKSLNLVASCKSHPYTWDDTIGLYYSGSKLSNSIYSTYSARKKILIEPQLKNNMTINNDFNNEKIPRCWAASEIKIGTKNIKIVSIHLSGGRFDDVTSLKEDNFIIKIRQILKMVADETPDIICGDLNTKLVPKRTINDTYFLGLSFDNTTVQQYFVDNPDQQKFRYLEEFIDEDDDAKKQKRLEQIYFLIDKKIRDEEFLENENNLWANITLAEKWHIWMYGLDYLFKKNSYKSVFQIKPKNIPHHRIQTISSIRHQKIPCRDEIDNLQAPNTTIFGGTVDVIYYNCDKIYCTSGGEAVPGVISFQNKTGKRILSDHAPVKASFRIL